jgi:hypothetical protein
MKCSSSPVDPRWTAGFDPGIIRPVVVSVEHQALVVSGRAIRAEEFLHLREQKARDEHRSCHRAAVRARHGKLRPGGQPPRAQDQRRAPPARGAQPPHPPARRQPGGATAVGSPFSTGRACSSSATRPASSRRTPAPSGTSHGALAAGCVPATCSATGSRRPASGPPSSTSAARARAVRLRITGNEERPGAHLHRGFLRRTAVRQAQRGASRSPSARSASAQ